MTAPRLRVAAALACLYVPHARAASCLPVKNNRFCSGVAWNVSLGLPASEIDEMARADTEAALTKLSPPCYAAWKALNCARKFPKCLPGTHVLAQTACRALCVDHVQILTSHGFA